MTLSFKKQKGLLIRDGHRRKAEKKTKLGEGSPGKWIGLTQKDRVREMSAMTFSFKKQKGLF
jgi:hypothetical protein